MGSRKEELRERLHFFWNLFCMITTCIFFAVAFSDLVINPHEVIEAGILWQVPLIAAITAVSSFIYPRHPMSGFERNIRILIHYLLILATVLTGGYWFGWYTIHSLASVLAMIFAVTAIFFLVSVIVWSRAEKEARNLNQKLRELQERNQFSDGRRL